MDIEKIRYLPRVQEILAELERIKDARAELMDGQSVSISGSHSRTMVKLEELRVLEADYKRELLTIAQVHGVTDTGTGSRRVGVKYE